MLFRVLSLALLWASSAYAAAIAPPGEADPLLSDDVPLAALLYGFRYTDAAAVHPMNDANGNLMWDASGLGCVEAGGWADSYPSEKGDLREPAFCIPQPCVALLSPEELSREVYGRPLEQGEYQTYLDRLEETCGDVPTNPAVDEARLGLDELLGLGSFQLVSSVADDYQFTNPWMPAGYAPLPLPGDPAMGGALSPVDYLASPTPTNLLASFRSTGGGRSGLRPDAHRPSRSHSSGSGGRPRSGGGPNKPIVTQFTPPTPGQPTPPTPPTPPWTPKNPDGPGNPGGGDTLTPVPLAGGLPLMLTAMGVYAVGRRLPLQRRRSRRELIG